MSIVNDISLRDIYVGQQADRVWSVTSDQIDLFAELSGDNNPLHVSADYAIENNFDDRVAHGFLLGAQLSGLIGTTLPGRRCLLLEEDLAFPAPVYPGDMITITCIVEGLWDDLSLVELKVKAIKIDMKRKKKITVARGKVRCKILS